MTDSDIIKALENNVKRIEYCEVTDEEVLDLITRQKAEIERLKAGLKKDSQTIKKAIVLVEEIKQEFANDIKTAKAEAIKEFAERVKDLFIEEDKLIREEIDNLVKEMVGDV